MHNAMLGLLRSARYARLGPLCSLGLHGAVYSAELNLLGAVSAALIGLPLSPFVCV
jgi:hypothetical protein